MIDVQFHTTLQTIAKLSEEIIHLNTKVDTTNKRIDTEIKATGKQLRKLEKSVATLDTTVQKRTAKIGVFEVELISNRQLFSDITQQVSNFYTELKEHHEKRFEIIENELGRLTAKRA